MGSGAGAVQRIVLRPGRVGCVPAAGPPGAGRRRPIHSDRAAAAGRRRDWPADRGRGDGRRVRPLLVVCGAGASAVDAAAAAESGEIPEGSCGLASRPGIWSSSRPGGPPQPPLLTP